MIEDIVFLSHYLACLLWISFSKILSKLNKRAIGLTVEKSSFDSFLWRDMTLLSSNL